jgi:DNA-binding transcriptional LysR family regulator
MHSFALPFPTPEVTVSSLWHARFDADPAHRWLRTLVRQAVRRDDIAPTPR